MFYCDGVGYILRFITFEIVIFFYYYWDVCNKNTIEICGIFFLLFFRCFNTTYSGIYVYIYPR